MARQMPYSNFHDLNLDWVIKQVKTAYTKDNPPPYPVKSVNGKTGVVTLYGTDILYSDMVGMTLREALDYLADWCVTLGDDIAGKISWPDLGGNPGDVLALDNDYNPVWIPPTQPVTDYDDLTGKPQINGHTLSGDKSGADLEILDAPAVAGNAGEVLQSNGDNTQSWVNLNNKFAPIIKDTASGDPATFPDGLADMEMIVQAVINPVQDLHGYANPWPGGGGKNKFNVDALVNTADITISNGNIIVKGTSKNSGKTLAEVANIVEGETYTLSANTTGANNFVYLYGVNNSWTFGSQRTITAQDLSSILFFYGSSDPDESITISDMMIRISSDTDTTFAPYSNICPISGHAGLTLYTSGSDISNPDVYPVAWGDVAGMVYGGTFNSKTGKLIVTHGYKALSSINWSVDTNRPGVFYGSISGRKNSSNIAYCDTYKVSNVSVTTNIDFYISGNFSYGGNAIFLRDTRYAGKTGAEFKNLVSGNVVYELATPVEYDLYTIDNLETLYGDNNVWTDVGPVSVDYYADTKLFILKVV